MSKIARIVISITSLGLLIAPGIASAVDYGGVGGQPANPSPDNPRTKSIFVYTLKPGETKSDGLNVFNNTPKAKIIALDAVDSVVSSDGAFACAQSSDAKKDVGSWLSLDTKQITLDPNTKAEVPFTISIPPNASVGEHDGCVTVQDVSPSATTQKSNGVILGFRSALRVVITIPGKIVKKLSFVSLGVVKSPNNQSYIAQPAVRNDGNVSVDAKINTALKSLFGSTLQSNGGTYPVLPRTTGSWNFEFKKPFWGGWYSVQATATYNNDVTKAIGQAGANATITSHKRYIFVPPAGQALLIELLIAALIIGALWLIYRKVTTKRELAKGAKTYRVKAGDTLHSIAKKSDLNWKDVARLNKLRPPYHIEPGSTINLPKSQVKRTSKKQQPKR